MADGELLYDAIAGRLEEPSPPRDAAELIGTGRRDASEVAALVDRSARTVRRWREAGRIPPAMRGRVEEAWRVRHPFDAGAALVARIDQLRRRGGHVTLTAVVICSDDEDERDIAGFVPARAMSSILAPIAGGGSRDRWAEAEDALVAHVQTRYFEDDHVGCHIEDLVSISITVGPRPGESAARPGWRSRM